MSPCSSNSPNQRGQKQSKRNSFSCRVGNIGFSIFPNQVHGCTGSYTGERHEEWPSAVGVLRTA